MYNTHLCVDRCAKEAGALIQSLPASLRIACTQSEDPNTDPWGVDYGKITPLLVKAIQDQQKMIESLQQKIADLEEALR